MKKTVFLTGATGNMGFAGFRELYARKDRFNVRVLARDSRKNRKLLEDYTDDDSVEIVWGDMLSYDDVLKGVTGADYVLHVGGMVSPAADYYPEKTLKVNVKSAEIVAKAVLAQDDPSKTKVVYIGSVAQLGDRLYPYHWGRSGDPVVASPYDMYSVSKCRAEKAIVDSGLPHWVSLRQSGILHPHLFGALGPTAFHVPVGGVLEWTTIEDSGRLLANVCEDWVPESFWNNFYNIGSGEQYRMTNYEFEKRLLRTIGLGCPEDVFEANWFALKNFHGMWYEDSDRLENILHFRENLPLDDYFKRLRASLPWFFSLSPLAPKPLVKKFLCRYTLDPKLGTQYWAKNDPDRLKAYFGSEDAYCSIRSWDDVRPAAYEKNAGKARAKGELKHLDHGWDESKSIYELTDEEIQEAAAFRGGRFLGPVEVSDDVVTSETVKASDAANVSNAVKVSDAAENADMPEVTSGTEIRTNGKLYRWQCSKGHIFTASLEYVLLGGGWCPDSDCIYDSWADMQ